jgi:hypothetical protein
MLKKKEFGGSLQIAQITFFFTPFDSSSQNYPSVGIPSSERC